MTEETNETETVKDLDIYTCSCKFWAPSGAQVSVAATDEEDAKRQLLEIMADHKDVEVVSIHNMSRINMPTLEDVEFVEGEAEAQDKKDLH